MFFGRGRRRHRPRFLSFFFFPPSADVGAREADCDWQVTGEVATVCGALCEGILSVALHSLQLWRVPAVSVHVYAPPACQRNPKAPQRVGQRAYVTRCINRVKQGDVTWARHNMELLLALRVDYFPTTVHPEALKKQNVIPQQVGIDALYRQ